MTEPAEPVAPTPTEVAPVETLPAVPADTSSEAAPAADASPHAQFEWSDDYKARNRGLLIDSLSFQYSISGAEAEEVLDGDCSEAGIAAVKAKRTVFARTFVKLPAEEGHTLTVQEGKNLARVNLETGQPDPGYQSVVTSVDGREEVVQ